MTGKRKQAIPSISNTAIGIKTSDFHYICPFFD